MTHQLKSFADLQSAIASRTADIQERGPAVPDEEYVARVLRQGFVTLTPEQMALVLRLCEYEHQRKINPRHIEVLSDLMARDQWGARSTLDFARLDNGRLVLVNGYHRAHAQVRTGKTIEWTVVIHDCETMEELGKLYYRFDTNALVRSESHILEGVEFAQENRIHRETASRLFKAIPFIAAGFSTKVSDRDLLTTKVIDRRLEMARQYAIAARAFEQCVRGTPATIKSKLFSRGCMSVALVTLRYQRSLAVDFWAGVAQNDGLRKGDPRQTLFNLLLQRTGKGNNLAPAAIAWNAYFNERELRIIKIPEDYRCHIDGTPFAKNWRPAR